MFFSSQLQLWNIYLNYVEDVLIDSLFTRLMSMCSDSDYTVRWKALNY